MAENLSWMTTLASEEENKPCPNHLKKCWRNRSSFRPKSAEELVAVGQPEPPRTDDPPRTRMMR